MDKRYLTKAMKAMASAQTSLLKFERTLSQPCPNCDEKMVAYLPVDRMWRESINWNPEHVKATDASMKVMLRCVACTSEREIQL